MQTMYSLVDGLKILSRVYNIGDRIPQRPRLLRKLSALRRSGQVGTLIQLNKAKTEGKESITEPETVEPYVEEEKWVKPFHHQEMDIPSCHTVESLSKLKMGEIRVIGNSFGVKDNDKSDLINKIIEKQK